jgi:hypothetical protein
MKLVGFRLAFFPFRRPFYCLQCTKAMSDAKGWQVKGGWALQPAIPVIRTDDGLVRHVQIGRLLTRAQGFIMDDEVASDSRLMTEIHQHLAYLGLRLKPSLPVPVASPIRCKRCASEVAD